MKLSNRAVPNMKKNYKNNLLIIGTFFLICLLASCVNVKKLTYFNTINHDSISNIEPLNLEEKIRKNDIIQVNVFTSDDVVTHLLNPSTTIAASSVGVPTLNYLVDEGGEIKFPILGVIKVEGLTKRELSAFITNEILEKKIAKDPVVTVRLANYQITVLGEVARPGVLPIVNERITLPEAIGAAGDLTIYGRRDNILLIREINGKRLYKRFNLNNQQIFEKDIYILQNHDIIYVEPNQAKASSSDNSPQYISIGVSLLSLLVVIYSQLIR